MAEWQGVFPMRWEADVPAGVSLLNEFERKYKDNAGLPGRGSNFVVFSLALCE